MTPTIEGATVRRGVPADAEQIAALFSATYRDSSHPFQSQQDVIDFLLDERNVAVVAALNSGIASSMAMTYWPWNDSYELSRALTHPDHRARGLIGALMQPTIDGACSNGIGEVFFGFARARRIVDLSRTLRPAMILVGHDGGRNVANGSRETHLTMYSVAPHAAFTPVAPRSDLYDRSFVDERIYIPLGLNPAAGEYPPESFVGMDAEHAIAFESFLFHYDPASPNGALEIVGDCVRPGRPMRLSFEIDRLCRTLPELRHITATVLADKSDVVEELVGAGFEASAYLPAWYKVADYRYDCVQLVKRRYAERPYAGGFDVILSQVEADLALLVPASRRRRVSA